jgi:hypothetical protein
MLVIQSSTWFFYFTNLVSSNFAYSLYIVIDLASMFYSTFDPHNHALGPTLSFFFTLLYSSFGFITPTLGNTSFMNHNKKA